MALQNECFLNSHSEKSDFLKIFKDGEVDRIITFLSEHSVTELDKCFDDQGHGPLHWACLQGHTNVVKLLIDYGASINIRAENLVGKQPIHWACANGHLPAVSLLLKAGVDVNSSDNSGSTPLLVASQFGHTLLVNYLINEGANIQQRDQYRNSALHWAAFRGHEELCSLLGYFGLDANDVDNFGHTALHLAVKGAGFWTVHALITRSNINIRALNHNGQSALDVAVEMKKNVIARAIKEKYGNATNYEKFKNFVFGPPGNSTFGIWFFVVNVIFWGYPMYLYHALISTWSTIKIAHGVFFLCNIIMWCAFFKCRWTDPGVIARNCKSYHVLVQQVSNIGHEINDLVERKGIDFRTNHLKYHPDPATRLCHSCRCIRPIRSKHCRKCDQCIMNFDHHCPYIGNCVGLNNRPYFFIFAFSIFMNCCLGVYISRAVIQLFGWSWLYVFGFAQMCIFTFLSITLLLFMIYYISQNLTTNEILNRKKYEYLRDPVSGKYRNVFSRGIIQNFISYFTCIPSSHSKEYDIVELDITSM